MRQHRLQPQGLQFVELGVELAQGFRIDAGDLDQDQVGRSQAKALRAQAVDQLENARSQFNFQPGDQLEVKIVRSNGLLQLSQAVIPPIQVSQGCLVIAGYPPIKMRRTDHRIHTLLGHTRGQTNRFHKICRAVVQVWQQVAVQVDQFTGFSRHSGQAVRPGSPACGQRDAAGMSGADEMSLEAPERNSTAGSSTRRFRFRHR